MSSAAGEIKMQIRVARAGDAPALADLSTQLGYPSTPAQIAERLERIFGDPDHVVFVVEVDGGRVAGFLHGFSGIALETGPQAHIQGLVVDSTVRGQGVGARLIAETEDWARSKGHHALTVRCNVVRTAAHAFYEARGFVCTKTQKHYSKQL